MLTVLSIALCSASCGAPIPARTDRATRTRAVLVIGLDGLRPDALTRAETPHLDRLFGRGRSTMTGLTHVQGDTSSGPGWASVMTGVDALEHGVLHNGMDAQIRRDQFPTFLQRATERTHWVGVASEDPRVPVMLEPTLRDEVVQGPAGVVVAGGVAMLREGRDVVFIVLEGIDEAGHASGFSANNPRYLSAVEEADAAVGRLVAALGSRPESDWMVVVVSDHGGEGHGHGPQTPGNQIIPIAYASERLGDAPLEPSERSQLLVAPSVLAWLRGERPFR